LSHAHPNQACFCNYTSSNGSGDDGGAASGGQVLLGLGCIMVAQVIGAVQFIVE
jgi:hypothetical protein